MTFKTNPEISTVSAIIFILMIAVLTGFVIYSFFVKKKRVEIQRYYMILCVFVSIWLISMVGMWLTPQDNTVMLWFWDSVSNIGSSFSATTMLIICLCLIYGEKKLPFIWYSLYVVSIITVVIVWTNPFHHLMYANSPFFGDKAFSIVRADLIPGPYFYVQGVYLYLCLVAAITSLLVFAIKRKNKIVWSQALLLSVGSLVPLMVSVIATAFPELNFKITATPMSFLVVVTCNYVAIYAFHVLDITPIAKQHVLDLIQDGYLITNENRLVIDSNKAFSNGFGKYLGIENNKRIDDFADNEEPSKKTIVYNIISNIIACGDSNAPLSYEQVITTVDEEENEKKTFFMIDITPLIINKKLSGFAIIFKDITQIKLSMLQVQEGRTRLMEQERLAMLGQMVGGLAHNLKTPIMNIAGCTSSVERLLQEINDSLGDPDVNDDDYREITGELYGWTTKIRESCSYMSDVISAIKGQAAGAATKEDKDFLVDEAVKCINLLMKHEFQTNGCQLVQDCQYDKRLSLHGDMNGLIQVLNNLLSNAIFAESKCEKKIVYLNIYAEGNNLIFSVVDTGTGINPEVKEKLFQKMITTKGNKGTGLGLYISSTIIRSKFGGSMWCDNNPDGGAVFGVTIPIKRTAAATVAAIEGEEK